MIPKHEPLPCEQTFPWPTSTRPFWRTQPSRLDSHRSTPDLPAHTDIAIIGAGLSGVSLAYHLVRNSASPPSVALLEARELCSGATGRNGGHLKLATSRYATVMARHGVDVVKEVVDFHLRQIYAMKDVVEREGIDCDFLCTRSFDVFMDEGVAEAARADVQKLIDAGVDLVRREVQVLKKEAIEAVTGVKGAAGARGVPAASLWPYKFVCGLMEKILDRVNLQTHTVVQRVAETAGADGYFDLVTSRGTIKARKVIFASNAYTAGVLPDLRGVIVPWKGTASRVVRRPRKHFQQCTFTYNIFKENKHVDYLIHRLDGGTIIGGAREVFEDDQAAWLATVDDSTLIDEGGCRRYFEWRLERCYQDWEDSGAEVQHIWTGIMGYTQDGYPLIGEVPGRQNQYIMAGFNGGGMSHIFLCSKGLAGMLVDELKFAQTGIPSIFEITNDRLDQARNSVNSEC